MRTAASKHHPRRGAAAGFSLVELLVTVIVVAEILLIAGLMFDVHNKTAQTQNQIADTQQSLRVAQREMVDTLRMAGRGGLRANLPPPGTGRIMPGLALTLDDNVDAGTQIVVDEARTNVVPGTDVLRVRGVMGTPLYQLLSAGLGERNLRLTGPPGAEDNPSIADAGQVDVFSPSPSGSPQDLTPLLAAEAGDALIMVSPLSDGIYAVVAVSSVVVIEEPPAGFTGVTVSFQIIGSDYQNEYSAFFGGPFLPSNLSSAAFVGLLEEHVFFVRETFAIPGDPGSDLMPKLAHVRVHPGTNVAVDGTGDDLADNVLDLQVALGFNSSLGAGGYLPADNPDLVIAETADGTNDDWLFNGAADDPGAPPWVDPWSPLPGTPQPELYYVRISTLARTGGREFKYISPPIDRIENHVYAEAMVPAEHDPERAYHRRMLRTIVDLRNL
jgi:hypothetical protein